MIFDAIRLVVALKAAFTDFDFNDSHTLSHWRLTSEMVRSTLLRNYVTIV